MNLKCGISDVVGARIGVYPMQDNFVDVILKALKDTDRTGLCVMTDDLGTTVQGKRERVFNYVKEVLLRTSNIGGHVVANVLFSVGCPGDVAEDFDFNTKPKYTDLPMEDMPVACAWSLYPLGNEQYFPVIVEEVKKAMDLSNVDVESYHYCTRLDGTAKDVFNLLETSFKGVSKRIPHTIIHATFSKGSPSKIKEKIEL